uniref:Uncharacterized protein n=1 Tax=Vespula pensylvanica TaxID=30213 RepID=A0A834P3Y8_VESPE|nr:hypothetical protein H0235_007038 [Vespula pensylvanica]
MGVLDGSCLHLIREATDSFLFLSPMETDAFLNVGQSDYTSSYTTTTTTTTTITTNTTISTTVSRFQQSEKIPGQLVILMITGQHGTGDSIKNLCSLSYVCPGCIFWPEPIFSAS